MLMAFRSLSGYDNRLSGERAASRSLGATERLCRLPDIITSCYSIRLFW